MNKKKIVHLIQALDNGGCENMLLRTLPYLSNFEHTIITLKKRGDLADQFEEKNILTININQRSLLDIFAYPRLFSAVQAQKPDLIITYLFHADIIGRLFLQSFAPIKIIPFLRTTYNHSTYWIPRLFEKMTKYFVRFYLANSESVKNFYVEKIGVEKSKIIVIQNGINVAFYDTIRRDFILREKLGVKLQNKVILCVGNLSINKGHTYLLKAFELLYKKHKDIELLIVGDGSEKKNLMKQIENYTSKSNISFLGKRYDVPSLLKLSDIFVLATLFEGMSTPIMEAMASKLAIITTDIPENKELINNNKSGILVPVKNSFEIKNSLERILENDKLRIKLGEMAHKEILNRFEMNNTLCKLSDTFARLAGDDNL